MQLKIKKTMENLEKTPNSQRFSAPLSLSNPLICDIHNEQIFNFCLNLECLKPLCPECINEHQDYHTEKDTKADFSTIRAVKTSCSKKIEAGIISLNQEVKRCELEYLLDPEALIENGVRRIKKFKERLTFMIESHCLLLEETLKRRVHENLLKGSDFEGVFQEMKNIINEMEFLRKNLDSNNGISYIKKICMLDLKALMKNFKSKVQRVVGTKDLEPIDIHVDEVRFKQFKNELENLIYIQKENNNNLNFSHVEEINTKEFNNIINETNNFKENVKMADSFQKEKIKNATPFPLEISDSTKKEIHNEIQEKPSQKKEKIFSLEKSAHDLLAQSKMLRELRFEKMKEFFQFDSKKFLYFFQKYEKKSVLHVLNLDRLNLKKIDVFFANFHLDAFEIPAFSKSISTPEGDIYLIGGDENFDSTHKIDKIYEFSEKNVEMQEVGHLNIPRSSHGLCIFNKKIYIIGGYSKNSLCDQCERFDYYTKNCEIIRSPLKFAVAHPSLCVFESSIFKFGGIDADKNLIQRIEKFDCFEEQWEEINWQQPEKIPIKLLMDSYCIPMNESAILILGGYDEKENSVSQALLFCFDDNSPNNAIVQENKELRLSKRGGLLNNEGVWFNKRLYLLQNKSETKLASAISEYQKDLLILDPIKGWEIHQPNN